MERNGFIDYLKNKYKSGELIGCEIGISSGTHVIRLLDTLNIKKMYMIDPYCEYTDGDGKVKNRWTRYFKMRKDLFRYRNQTIVLRKTSDDAVDFIKDPLDFVYIDGNHSYENVKNDINNYHKKLTTNGVLGGDDYDTCFSGVKRAVDEFVKDTGLELIIVGREFIIDMEVKKCLK